MGDLPATIAMLVMVAVIVAVIVSILRNRSDVPDASSDRSAEMSRAEGLAAGDRYGGMGTGS